MNDYIIVIRLISGEDIIAVAIDDSNDTFIEIEHPFIVAYNPKDGAAILRPYQVWTDDHTFIIYNRSIITISNANDEICNYYKEVMSRYSKYMSLKPDVNDLQELIDNLGISSNQELEEPSVTSIAVEGTNTKH